MAYAVSVFFDSVLDLKVRSVWQSMAQKGGSSFLADGPYRPHLTLAIYEQLDVVYCASALNDLALTQARFPISLSYVGAFTGTENTVFFAATMTQSLFDLHRQVYSSLQQHAANPHTYYLPDRWHPHCSVARQVEPGDLPGALDLGLQTQLPMQGAVEGLGLIETPVERELNVYRLR